MGMLSGVRRPSLWALSGLGLLTLLIFAPVLIQGRHVVIGESDHDMPMYFYWMRQWGFAQLRHGHFPLWNPHVYCGMPFFGTTLSALLYPPNALFLVLPTSLAMNWSFALHVFLAGAFTFAWARVRGISHVGSFVAAAIYMFCGAHFYKIGVGWPNLTCAITWIPLVFVCIDKLFKSGKLSWSWLGGFAMAMQVLCGGSQYAFFTALVSGIYVALNLSRDRQHWRKVVAGTGLIFALAGGLCAFQLAAAADLGQESVRSGGMGVQNATVGSFPPSAFLTLLSPYVYGRRDTPVADGSIRWLVLNVGIAGLLLAAYGAIRAERRQRRFAVAIIILICLLAVGIYSPLYRWLYNYVPGYRYFRAMSRFMTLASLFMAMLAGAGFDRLRSAGSRPARLAWLPAIIAVLTLSLGAAIWCTRGDSSGGVWGAMLKLVDRSGEMHARAMRPGENETPAQRAAFSAIMLLISGGLLAAVAATLAGMSKRRWIGYGLAGLAVVELAITAGCSLVWLRVPLTCPQAWTDTIAQMPTQQRTWQTDWRYPNWAMGVNKLDANGYDPAMLKRFETLLLQMSDGAPYHGEGGWAILRYPPLAEMLRVGRFLGWNAKYVLAPTRRPMPRMMLIDTYRVAGDEKEMFRILKSPDFEPRKLVVLESEPAIRPEASDAGGTVRVVREDTDSIEIKAHVPHPAILLMTDAYSQGWRAMAVGDSSQQSYEIMPANYVLRAIPLAAGEHHFVLRYRPKYYVLSLCISLATVLAYVIGGAAMAMRRRGTGGQAAPGTQAIEPCCVPRAACLPVPSGDTGTQTTSSSPRAAATGATPAREASS